jgi:uncharacterized membrane protein
MRIRPSYAAYVVSFAVIGIIWVNHHQIFAGIIAVDRPLLFLNLLLLLTVAFLLSLPRCLGSTSARATTPASPRPYTAST